ncbi:MAG TPA: alpha/beta fold hydrolase [Chthoniobacteraceae bacterium]|nr:alpha/beta fold hydrolase [Chthoniobacteraceae bacterium]
MRVLVLSFCLLALGLGGCATRTRPACPTAAPGRAARVYFATDRERTAGGGSLQFGRERTEPASLHVGWEDVALGPKHGLGQVDAAVAITPRFAEESSRGGEGTSLNRSDREIGSFVEGSLRRAIRASAPPVAGQPRQVLVFIHGFNNTFDESIRKAAQLAGDLELLDCDGRSRGVAIAYSWPAQGAILSYLADEENAEWTQQRLVPFLQALSGVCQQEHAELHLVAHSMGSRVLVRSLADLANSGHSHPIGHVILLAPDMAKSLFDQYLQRALPLVQHLTIYVSAKDRALSISRIVHGGHDRVGLIESTLFTALSLTGLTGHSHRELGQAPELAVSGKVDLIDVSNGLAGQFGHSYEDPAFIRDLRELIYRDTPAGTGARGNLEKRTAAKDLFHSLSGDKISYFQLRQ